MWYFDAVNSSFSVYSSSESFQIFHRSVIGGHRSKLVTVLENAVQEDRRFELPRMKVFCLAIPGMTGNQ